MGGKFENFFLDRLRLTLHNRLHSALYYTRRLRCGRLRGGCQTVKGKRSSALFELAGELQASENFRESEAGAVLDDHDAVRSDEVGFVEGLERAEVVVAIFVGRIEKNIIGDEVTRAASFCRPRVA